MAIVNGYATLAELKARMGVPLADTADDSIMEAVIEAASRMIDKFCNRFFFQTAAGQVRYFSPASAVLVFVDDVTAVTAVATDRNLNRTWSNVISSSDYELGPLNNAVSSWPFTEIRMKPLAGESFDLGLEMVKVTGTYGFSAIPDAVNEACLLASARYFKRKDAAFGVAGGGEVGQVVALRAVDPDVGVLLAPYRKIGLVGLV
jgi:hypothetical protein